MAVTLASKTLKAINDALEKDQGGAYRQFLEKVIPHMKDAYRGVEAIPFRTHLGASVIGGECARQIWYGFRWATVPDFKGRILRLFNRGHLEEARFIALLLTIGCQVFQQDANGNQYRISDVGGHFGGSGDGIGINLPDLPPDTPALLEFKTHNDKSFAKLKKEGVRTAKFEHFVQMQVYMRKMNLMYAMYGAVNKNDDDLYLEIITLDTHISDQFVDRARQIILIEKAPDKISNSPGWFTCTWCDHKNICHNGVAPAINCRTCQHAQPSEDGLWWCYSKERRLELLFPATNPRGEDFSLTKERQAEGCLHYLLSNRFT